MNLGQQVLEPMTFSCLLISEQENTTQKEFLKDLRNKYFRILNLKGCDIFENVCEEECDTF